MKLRYGAPCVPKSSAPHNVTIEMTYKRHRRNSGSLYLVCGIGFGTLAAIWLPYSVLTPTRILRGRSDGESQHDRVSLVPVRPAAIRNPSRPIYPYSVIRGGAYSAGELDQALRNDPVVAAHYADFDRGHMRVTQAPAAAAVYVSYRKDDRVYWTSRKIQLPAGESLLSDGVHTARVRCGNRVSLTPQGPVHPREPSAIELDVPQWSTGKADVPPNGSSSPRLAYEIFPAMDWNGPGAVPGDAPGEVSNQTPSGVSGGSVASVSGGPGFPGGMRLPTTPDGPLTAGVTGQSIPETTPSNVLPGVGPISPEMPRPPIGPGIGWPPLFPLPGSNTGVVPNRLPPGGTSLIPPTVPGPSVDKPAVPGMSSGPAHSATPGIVGGVLPPTVSASLVPDTAAQPTEAVLPATGPLPVDPQVPEPATVVLMLSGAAIIAARRYVAGRDASRRGERT